jgi:Uma2 family endonuclease
MTQEHNDVGFLLAHFLQSQLPIEEFRVRSNAGRARLDSGANYIPDVMVIPVVLMHRQRGTRELEAYDEPLPLVAEVWSPSTGEYDVNEKLLEYQRRGDHEIWLVHPYERTVISWVRQEDGSYRETTTREGAIWPSYLPGVAIELKTIFR